MRYFISLLNFFIRNPVLLAFYVLLYLFKVVCFVVYFHLQILVLLFFYTKFNTYQFIPLGVKSYVFLNFFRQILLLLLKGLDFVQHFLPFILLYSFQLLFIIVPISLFQCCFATIQFVCRICSFACL